jgi:hypothetical protein
MCCKDNTCVSGHRIAPEGAGRWGETEPPEGGSANDIAAYAESRLSPRQAIGERWPSKTRPPARKRAASKENLL